MKITEEKYYCDICRKEVMKSELRSVKLPMRVPYFDKIDKIDSTKIKVGEIELCPVCLEKVTLVDYTSRDSNHPFFIRGSQI